MIDTAERDKKSTLLIYAPVPLFQKGDELYLEAQACNGLRLWAENFDHVKVMMPLETGPVPADWIPLPSVGPSLERIEMHPLPTAYRPDQFARHYGNVKKRIRGLIAQSDYLSFAIGGLFGDWGAVACIQAHKMKRPYAVWTDRVESQVMRREADRGSWKNRLKAKLYHRPMAALERYVIRRASLGLFHGKDTFDTYSPFCRNPVLVHDIHISQADHIPANDLKDKIKHAGEGPIRLIYVGRGDAMKGPLDWVEVLEKLDAQGVAFRATWLGLGDLLDQAKSRVQQAGLTDLVSFPGFTTDRVDLLNQLRTAHIFMFCHKTPESPRCLIEALISGCPIVGYGSSFPEDLISGHQGGVLTPLDDTSALANAVAELAQDRDALADKTARAARDGAPFDDVSVFRHRSDVIKANL